MVFRIATGKRKNKFGAKKTTRNGITYASKMEADYHPILLAMERAGEIADLRLQPLYELQPGFVKDGKKEQPIVYIADYEYRDLDGKLIAVDVKGAETKDFKLKRKLFDYKYPDITLKVITKSGSQWIEIDDLKKREAANKRATKQLLKRAKDSQHDGRRYEEA